MASIWFIDTNVIASWVIVKSNLLSLLSAKYSLPSEYHRLYEERFKEDVEFIDRILNSDREKFQKKYEIYSSTRWSNTKCFLRVSCLIFHLNNDLNISPKTLDL